jgi:NAD(P)-dependent dehydrogenase (short-subunit alcohol dehydrogenase family)
MRWFKVLKRRRRIQDFQPVVLVTGCGSGIGLALAKLLDQETHYRVVITARAHSIEGLRAAVHESDRLWVRELDVNSRASRRALMQEIRAKWKRVNILINNAGISYRSVLEHMTEADERLQMSTNYLSPVALIRQVLPGMRRVGRGKIINVSSVSGMMAMPTMASYSASKYALEGMSEALWYEARPLGINVTLIQPGFVHSNSFKKVYYSKRASPDGRRGARLYVDYYATMAPFIEKLMRLSRTPPETVARRILRVMQTENPPLWVPATPDAIFFYYLRRWVPRRFLLPILFNLLPGARRWGDSYTNARERQRRYE